MTKEACKPGHKKHPGWTQDIEEKVPPCTIEAVNQVAQREPVVQSSALDFTEVPHTTRLYGDYLHNFPSVSRFYARPPEPLHWLAAEARSIRYDPSRRARVAAVLERQNRAWGASQRTLENLERLRAGACAAVTGQQVGLFGGPLFSLLKAVSALRLAKAANETGVDCVPVFWLATEDHDLAEVNHATLLGPDGLRTLRSTSKGVADAPISSVLLSDEIISVVEEAASLLDGTVADVLREAYRPGATLGGAFARLFAHLFAEFGVILLDAADPELHRIAQPVYRAAAEQASELNEALRQRGQELTSAKYHEQVKVTSTSTLLFTLHNGARAPVHRANSGFSVSKEKLATSELLARIEAHPEQFSANVLLRPVVQDYLLPTLAYIGGPAEVAYFAQAAVAYERVLGRVTPVLPRFSVTLLEPHTQRLLNKYGLRLTDLFHGPEKLRELMAAKVLPGDLQSAFVEADTSLEQSLHSLTGALEKLDPTLTDAARNAAGKMRHQLSHLRARAAQAELRRNEILTRHAVQLSAALYPEKTLQERVIAGVQYMARYPALITTLLQAATNGTDHHVVTL